MTHPERPPKKTEKLEVRLPAETKAAFLAACRTRGASASAVLRGFIDRYVGDAERTARFQLSKGLTMIKTSRSLRARLAAGALAVLGGVSFGFTPSAADDVMTAFFSWVDANSDGRITREEVARVDPPPSSGAWSVETTVNTWLQLRSAVTAMSFEDLDANNDGGITLAEIDHYGGMSAHVANGLLLDADSDGDGRVSEGELSAHLTGLDDAAEPRESLTRFASLLAHGIVTQYDANGDGGVDEAEIPDAG